jgi:hypothetical protein
MEQIHRVPAIAFAKGTENLSEKPPGGVEISAVNY